MSTPGQCRIEFYFKTADLEKLLNENKGAKGIIVSQEIRKEKPKGMDRYVNITHITARPDYGSKKPKPKGKTAKAAAAGGGEEFIDGCPYPPGCG